MLNVPALRELKSFAYVSSLFVLLTAAPLVLSQSAELPAAQSAPPPFELTPSDVAGQQNYDQPLRPQLHYTPLQGHIGDATGLVMYRGEYHLFNIFDEWARKSSVHKRWGHAVSNDLIHWQQMPALLDTAVDHAPGSGSGIVDWNNSSGLRTGPEKPILVFYTDYKKGSSILFSNDRGRTWERYKGNPVLTGIEDIRDPNVFWYPKASDWRMVRYEKRGFAFYSSKDLIHWTWLSRVEGFYECPDLFQLPIANAPGDQRWVLIDGDGTYVIGDFDGTRFIAESAKLRAQYGPSFYATQTWKLGGIGRAPVQMAWLKYPPQGSLTWDGQMSFPVELSLRRTAAGIRLIRQPIPAITTLRSSQKSWKDIAVTSERQKIPGMLPALLDLDVVMESKGAAEFGLTVQGEEMRYVVKTHMLYLGAIGAPLELEDGRLHLRLIVDRSSVEVFTDPGDVSISAVTLTSDLKPVTLLARGGKANLISLEANTLDSIWAAQGLRSAGMKAPE